MKELRHLNHYFYKYRGRLLLGLLITVVARLFALLIPMKVGDIVNVVEARLSGSISPEQMQSKLLTAILMIVGATLLSALFTFIMRQTIIVVSRYIEYDLKNAIFRQYERLSISFYKRNRIGDLMNRISEDVSKVRMYVGPALMYSTTTVTLFVVVLSYMIYKAPLLTLYAVAPLPVLSVLIYRLSTAIHKRSTIVQEYLSRLTTFTQESFSGITVIKAYGIEPRTKEAFTELAEGSKEKNIDLARVQALFFPLMMLLIGISNIVVVYIGGQQYISGMIELGTIVEFLIYVNLLTWPVAIVGWVTSIVQQAEASQKRINQFLNVEPEVQNHQAQPTPVEGQIRFNKLSFTYPDSNITALKEVSFTVDPGQTLAIVGKTGSGKSTILELIARLYDVEDGMLLLDDTPVSQLNLDNLRSAIGYVPQDAFLFSDTLANNIRFGKASASQEEVEQAARNAAVHDNIIGFTKGYETVLGERGISLSGGQKQRVSIARALIKDPEIYLFDDCLSAVDTETEEAILQNLNTVSSDKTTIIVSHRLSSAKNADQVIVLDEGRIIQQGTHQELVNKPGYYRELYHKQLSEKEI